MTVLNSYPQVAANTRGLRGPKKILGKTTKEKSTDDPKKHRSYVQFEKSLLTGKTSKDIITFACPVLKLPYASDRDNKIKKRSLILC